MIFTVYGYGSTYVYVYVFGHSTWFVNNHTTLTRCTYSIFSKSLPMPRLWDTWTKFARVSTIISDRAYIWGWLPGNCILVHAQWAVFKMSRATIYVVYCTTKRTSCNNDSKPLAPLFVIDNMLHEDVLHVWRGHSQLMAIHVLCFREVMWMPSTVLFITIFLILN